MPAGRGGYGAFARRAATPKWLVSRLLSFFVQSNEETPMKLYFAPGASSLSSHIALREAGLAFDLERVDLKSKKYGKERDFSRVNPKGYVPALQFEDGSVLTEGPAIVQWVADQVPEKRLAPAAGTMERYHLVEWLNFISTELHKQFSALFSPASSDAQKSHQRELIGRRFDFVQTALGAHPYLMGETFTVADACLFNVLSWCKWVEIDLAKWPKLTEYMARVAARPKVQAALAAEKPPKH
jgi:glutathione S-transferase